MNLETVYDTLFWGRFLDWCDNALNYKASYFFYRVMSLFDMLQINMVKRRRWDWPITIRDHCTEEELKEIFKIASSGLINW